MQEKLSIGDTISITLHRNVSDTTTNVISELPINSEVKVKDNSETLVDQDN